MRRHVSLVVLATISALTAVGSTSAAAAKAIQDRYCLQGCQWGYPGNCQFSSYAQCTATASGTDAPIAGSIPNTRLRASSAAPIGTDTEWQ
jgi:hypothetical protein